MRRVFITLGVGLAVLAVTSSVAWADPLDPLFGTWNGTWFVDEQFDSNGPVGTAPFPSAAIMFTFHDFGVGANNYGTLSIAGVPGAVVTSLSLTGSNIQVFLTYPDVPGPNNTGVMTGLLASGGITGRIDETLPPPPGWTAWRGPISLVPAPATLSLPLLIGAWATRRRRN